MIQNKLLNEILKTFPKVRYNCTATRVYEPY